MYLRLQTKPNLKKRGEKGRLRILGETSSLQGPVDDLNYPSLLGENAAYVTQACGKDFAQHASVNSAQQNAPPKEEESEISKVSSLSLHLNIDQFLHVRKLRKQGKRHLKGLEETVLGGSWEMVSIPTSQSAEFNTGHWVQYSLKESLPQYCRKSNPMLNAAMSHQKQTNKNLKSSI